MKLTYNSKRNRKPINILLNREKKNPKLSMLLFHVSIYYITKLFEMEGDFKSMSVFYTLPFFSSEVRYT